MTVAVAEFDDFPRQGARMIKQMDMFKSINPAFKATLYAIPAEMKDDDWKPIEERKQWLTLGVHGFEHRRGECRKLTDRFILDSMARIIDKPYDRICKPPFYGYGNRYIGIMHKMGYAMSCRFAEDIYKYFDNILDCPPVRTYCKYERPFLRVFGHPDNTPFMFGPSTKKNNIQAVEIADDFKFSSEVAIAHTNIYLASGGHHINNFVNYDKSAEGAVKWKFEQKLPYVDNSVSFVLIQHGLYLAGLDVIPVLFQEIKRVLCMGGVLLIKEDNDEYYIWRSIGQAGTKCTTNPRLMCHYLEQSGFEVKSHDIFTLDKKYSNLFNRRRRIKYNQFYAVEATKKGGRG